MLKVNDQNVGIKIRKWSGINYFSVNQWKIFLNAFVNAFKKRMPDKFIQKIVL
jgi:hypothetical protein